MENGEWRMVFGDEKPPLLSTGEVGSVSRRGVKAGRSREIIFLYCK
jgi:hypothetical protein